VEELELILDDEVDEVDFQRVSNFTSSSWYGTLKLEMFD